MNKSLLLPAAAIAITIATFSFAQMGMRGGMGPGMMGGEVPSGASMARHQYVMRYGLARAYVGARNPLPASAVNLKAGKTLFDSTCASCHGAAGRGDGPAAKGLNPAPADLSAAVKMPIATDAFLDWTISEGGVPVGGAMPPFKTALTQDDIWKVVLYLRTL
jgi:mono/diheme cytochrome c family protein